MTYLYLDGERLKQAVTNAKKLCKLADERYGKHTALLTTGLSGDVMGSHVALAMDVGHTVVRKDGVTSHGSTIENGGHLSQDGANVLIVDDFVSTGATVIRLLLKGFTGYKDTSSWRWTGSEVSMMMYAPMDNPMGVFVEGPEKDREEVRAALERMLNDSMWYQRFTFFGKQYQNMATKFKVRVRRVDTDEDGVVRVARLVLCERDEQEMAAYAKERADNGY